MSRILDHQPLQGLFAALNVLSDRAAALCTLYYIKELWLLSCKTCPSATCKPYCGVHCHGAAESDLPCSGVCTGQHSQPCSGWSRSSGHVPGLQVNAHQLQLDCSCLPRCWQQHDMHQMHMVLDQAKPVPAAPRLLTSSPVVQPAVDIVVVLREWAAVRHRCQTY